jgi:hypothetical protein
MIFGFLREELVLDQIRCSIALHKYPFNVKKEEWRFRQLLFRQNGLISLLDLFQVENGLPLGVWLI